MTTNVLLIDDSKTIHSIIRKLLIEDNIAIFSQFNANKSIDFLNTQKIDIILCDINMPGISGLEFCSLLKKTKHCEIPLIFLTSNSESKDLEKGLTTGANDYLLKPFKKEELKLRINNHIKLLNLQREKDKIAAKSSFNDMVDVLSHEINNPLFIAQSYFNKFHKILSKLEIPQEKYLIEYQKVDKSLNRIKSVLIKIREIDNAKDFYK